MSVGKRTWTENCKQWSVSVGHCVSRRAKLRKAQERALQENHGSVIPPDLLLGPTCLVGKQGQTLGGAGAVR